MSGERPDLGPEISPDISPLTLDVLPVSTAILRVKIGAPGRWEVPQALFANREVPSAPHWQLHTSVHLICGSLPAALKVA